MRVLLDECVPKRLRIGLNGHAVRTVVEMGWSGIKNGKLLAAAADEFDCMLTVDANMENQQHLPALPIAVLLVRSTSTDINTLNAKLPDILAELSIIQPKQFIAVG